MGRLTVKGIVTEDFTQYKECSMVVMFPSCTFKCEKESRCKMCQNSELTKAKSIDTSTERIIAIFDQSDISKALVLSGLEPFDSPEELMDLVTEFRKQHNHTIVIYTGYNKEELSKYIPELHQLGNVVIKYGRFIPNQTKHFDECLGVYLASENQYAELV